MAGFRQREVFIDWHKDGSVRARGQVEGSIAVGYWEWYRKDGARLRSGYFDDGRQVGEWTTYDQNGEVYKVTDKKSGDAKQPRTRVTISGESASQRLN